MPSGINAAVRNPGIDRTEAQRSIKIASIAPEAKQAAQMGAGARELEMPTRCPQRQGSAGPA